jgi:hypothetical protein
MKPLTLFDSKQAQRRAFRGSAVEEEESEASAEEEAARSVVEIIAISNSQPSQGLSSELHQQLKARSLQQKEQRRVQLMKQLPDEDWDPLVTRAKLGILAAEP